MSYTTALFAIGTCGCWYCRPYKCKGFILSRQLLQYPGKTHYFSNAMEQVTANLSGTIRRETLNGREHIVAPLSLIVPGVLDGSQGPLYYPSDEIARNPSVWNHIPIVVYHPILNGNQVSARDPDILNAQGIGVVLRAEANGKLVAEGWFDVDRTRKVDNRILESLEQGQPIELSTGLFTDNTPADEGATHNGTPYTHVARNYRPDHLAILPDLKGACSIDDGCGVLVNETETGNTHTGEGVTIMAKLSDKRRAALQSELIDNCDCWDDDDQEIIDNFSDGKLKALHKQSKTDKQAQLVANAVTAGFEDKAGNSHVYNSESGEWQSQIVAPPVEAAPVDNQGKGDEEAPAPLTTDEWLATAPADIQSAVRNAMEIEGREKIHLVQQLTANVPDDSKALLVETLQGKELAELRTLAVLAPAPSEPAPVPNYAGAAAPTGNQQIDEVDRNDILPLPTIKFSRKQA